MKVTDFINGKVTYDKEGQYLWIEGRKNGIQMLGEIRGWGHIQNMFNLNMDKAAAFQDEVGEWVAQAINEKREREKGGAISFWEGDSSDPY